MRPLYGLLVVAFAWGITSTSMAAAQIHWLGDISTDSLAGPGLFSKVVSALAGGSNNNTLELPFDVRLSAEKYLVLIRSTNELITIDRKTLKARHLKHTKNALVAPVAVVGTADDFYLSDPEQSTVFHGSDGRLVVFADSSHGLDRPTGLALDLKRGRLWIVDTGRHRVVGLSLTGLPSVEIGGRGEQDSCFNFPTFAAVDNDGSLIINDTMNGKIKKFSADGEFLWSAGGLSEEQFLFERAKGIATDGRGRIYVVDNLSDQVVVLTADGTLVNRIGTSGSGAGELWSPVGVAILGDTLVVADTQNHRLALFSIASEAGR
jgi:sugar lactone lactonase YvrE